jgi:phage replication-related protein YjqB (UPF0714/DUF867 family)
MKPLRSLRALLAHPHVEEVCRLGGRLGVMAYHGGNLERSTDAIATAVARSTGASLYLVRQRAPLRHHLPSTHFDPAESERLGAFLDHVDVAITLHGYGRRRLRRHVLLGGRNRDLAAHVATRLRARLPARYAVLDELATIPRELRGLHPRNPVNRPSGEGVQIELPPSLRWNGREWGWSDHAGVSRTAGVQGVIEALVDVARNWPARPVSGITRSSVRDSPRP